VRHSGSNVALSGLLLALSVTAGAQSVAPGTDQGAGFTAKDSHTTRLEAFALLQSFNAELLGDDSATLTLDRWCETHRLADPPEIVADRLPGVDKAPTAEQRQILRVSDSEPVAYRRVQLRCGQHVLSEAENWYVPSRLTPEMNQTLRTTNISFGRAVQKLNFTRNALSATLLWSPLPDGGEIGESVPIGTSSTLQIPAQVLEHRAVLTLPDGTPFSTVVETYTDDVLAFPEPPSPKPKTH
jgi:chorismate-pyruvate lyase